MSKTFDEQEYEQYKRLKRQEELIRTKLTKEEGVLERILSQLQSQFSCSSIDDAIKKVEELNVQEKRLRKRLAVEWDKFLSEYGDFFVGDGKET